MEINGPPEQLREHLDHAKETLVERLTELGRRFNEAKAKLDLKAHVVAHPFTSVGIAAAAGAFIALAKSRTPRPTVRGKLGQALLAALGSIALRAIRDVAFQQLGLDAKQWWDRDDQSGRSVTYTPA